MEGTVTISIKDFERLNNMSKVLTNAHSGVEMLIQQDVTYEEFKENVLALLEGIEINQ